MLKGVSLGMSKLEPINIFTTKSKMSRKFRDLTDLEVIPLSLGGVTNKFVLRDREKQIMVKFQKEKASEIIRDYISEYIGSSIAKKLGYPVQNVELAYHSGDECVAVELFNPLPTSFKGLGTNSADGVKMGSKGQNYNLQWLLELKMSTSKFDITQIEYEEWVWSVFFLDMFIGNFDRHEGNWGFIKKKGLYTIAPLFDNGACFYPKYIGTEKMSMRYEEIKHLVLFQTRCAILYEGKKKNFFELLDIVLRHQNVKRVFTSFLKRVDSTRFDSVYEYVIDYNKEYVNTIGFIKRVINIRRELLSKYE